MTKRQFTAEQATVAIGKTAKLLAKESVTVTTRGARAFVEWLPDGGVKRINLPMVPRDADQDFLDALQGFLDHEVGHVLNTKTIPGRALEADYIKRLGIQPESMRSMANIVEDVRIENAMEEQFRGCKRNLDAVRKFFVERMQKPILDGIDPSPTSDNERRAYIIPIFLRARGGQSACEHFMDDMDLWKYVEPYDHLFPDLAERLAALSSTEESVHLAAEIIERTCETTPPKDDEADDQKDDQQQDGEDGDDQSSQEQGEESENEQSGDQEQQEESEGGDDDQDEDPEESDDEGSSEGDQPDDDDTEDEGQGGDDSDDDDADFDSESSDDGGTDGDDSEDEGDDEGEDADGDDPEDDADESSDSDCGESEEGEDTDDTDDDIDGSGDAENQELDGADDTEVDEGDDGEDQAEAEKMIIGVDYDKIKDFDDCAADEFERIVGDMDTTDPYHIFSRDHDLIEPAEAYESAPVKKFEDRVEKTTGVLRKELQRLIAARSLSHLVPGKRSGRIHPASLHRLRVGDDRVFARKHEVQTKDTAVSLVVDCSGSMTGPKIVTAMEAAWAFSDTLSRLNVDNEVIGFTTNHPYFGNSKTKGYDSHEVERFRKTMGVPMQFIRAVPIYMPIFKDFNENFGIEQKRRLAAYPENGLKGANVDGESIRVAAHRLMQRRAQRRVMIVFSDGMPASDVAGELLDADLKKTVKELEAAKIETIGIGIQTRSVKQYYPKSFVIQNSEELAGTTLRELKAILTN